METTTTKRNRVTDRKKDRQFERPIVGETKGKRHCVMCGFEKCLDTLEWNLFNIHLNE